MGQTMTPHAAPRHQDGPRRPPALVPLAALMTVALAAPLFAPAPAQPQGPGQESPLPPPARARRSPVRFVSFLREAELPANDPLAPFAAARAKFRVDGKGLAVAVLDSGLNIDHVDFVPKKDRIPAQVNFTNEDNGNPEKVTDSNGHGTNIAGIVMAHGMHTGVAPGANVVPLKVLDHNGAGDFAAVEKALDWVLKNHGRFEITTVVVSLGDRGNYVSDEQLAPPLQPIRELIAKLRDDRVATVAPAGNLWYRYNKGSGTGAQQGMAFPAIVPATISVGAVFSQGHPELAFEDGSYASQITPGQIAPFSQRLSEVVNKACQTDVFAPADAIHSSGIDGAQSESVQTGTAQAAAVAAGALVLMQQYHKDRTGALPKVDDLERWLRQGSDVAFDRDGPTDNVKNTNLPFRFLDVAKTLDLIRRELDRRKP